MEFTFAGGFRELTDDELEMVSGGYEPAEIVVIGIPIPVPSIEVITDGLHTEPGEGGGAGGDNGLTGDPTQTILGTQVIGIDNECEAAAFQDALGLLLYASPTFLALWEQFKQSPYSWEFNLVNSGIDSTDITNTMINWDPYGGLELLDAQGNVIGRISPLVALAHEVAHAVNWASPNDYALTMQLERTIASELNEFRAHQAGYADHQSYVAYMTSQGVPPQNIMNEGLRQTHADPVNHVFTERSFNSQKTDTRPTGCSG